MCAGFSSRGLACLLAVAIGAATIIPSAFVPLAAAQAQTGGAGNPSDPLERLAGKYTVEGYSPSGSRYHGIVEITAQDGLAYFRWEIGDQIYEGKGTLDGDTLTVDWGQAAPVIYTINEDGTLDGQWDNGKASERLTPQN